MSRISVRHLILALPLLVAGAAQAQTTIDQAKALAGGITAGDTPGFPITLSATGSYVLTSNLIVPGNATGISITAPNVTLDLNGFSIIGPVACELAGGQVLCSGPTAGSFRGISATLDGVTIRNGHVRGFAETGVSIRGGLVEDVQVESNHGTGISAGGSPTDFPARVSGVRARLNYGSGIYTRNGILERVVSSANGTGVAGYGLTLIDSVIVKNTGAGLSDISNGAAQPSALKGTMMHGNGGPSITGTVRSMGGNLIDDVAF